MTRHIALAALIAATAACSEGGAPCDAEMGWPIGKMPDVDMLVGDTVETPLADRFTRPACFSRAGDDIWVVQSADPAAVAVSVSEHVLTTAALGAADSVRVTVGVDNELIGGYKGDSLPPHEFFVRVRPPPAGR